MFSELFTAIHKTVYKRLVAISHLTIMSEYHINKPSFTIKFCLYLLFLFLNWGHHYNLWDFCCKNIFCVVSDMWLKLWRVILLIDNFDEVAFELAAHINFHEGAALAARVEGLIDLVEPGLKEG